MACSAGIVLHALNRGASGLMGSMGMVGEDEVILVVSRKNHFCIILIDEFGHWIKLFLVRRHWMAETSPHLVSNVSTKMQKEKSLDDWKTIAQSATSDCLLFY